jgi:hypothetical protein
MSIAIKLKTENTTISEEFQNPKNVERGEMDAPNTQIHDRSLSWKGLIDLLVLNANISNMSAISWFVKE